MNQKLVPNFEKIPDRWSAYSALKNNPDCHFLSKRISAEENWRLHADFAFEVSPRGNGLDCFRTWESLFLQTIPIVKTSTLDPLYVDEGFPVAIVDSFEEITTAKLRDWREELGHKFTLEMSQKLTVDFWRERVRKVQQKYRENVVENR